MTSLTPASRSARARNAFTSAPALLIASLSAVAALQTDAQAASDEISLKFDVYSGNIRLFNIALGMQVGGPRYQVNASIKSKGLVSLVAKTRISLNAKGKTAGTKLRPSAFASRTKSKGRKRNISVGWDKKLYPTAKRNYDLSKEKQNALAKVVKPGMVDPLSHMVRRITNPGGGKPCTGTERVYDGKVVGEYRYRLLTETKFGANAGGAYHGKALKCELRYRAIAGLSAAKLAKQAKQKPVFTIWYAPVAGNSGQLYVPVAADGKLSGRAFAMRLTSGSVSGKSLATRRAVAVKRNPDLEVDK
ncbi:MAG: DUF3108 domain-containing protein [Pseudomonadota bacterium]